MKWDVSTDIGVMLVCVVGADSHVSSCFSGLLFLSFSGGSMIVFLFSVLCW
jgi:hypothetical protein